MSLKNCPALHHSIRRHFFKFTVNFTLNILRSKRFTAMNEIKPKTLLYKMFPIPTASEYRQHQEIKKKNKKKSSKRNKNVINCR